MNDARFIEDFNQKWFLDLREFVVKASALLQKQNDMNLVCVGISQLGTASTNMIRSKNVDMQFGQICYTSASLTQNSWQRCEFIQEYGSSSTSSIKC